jgi:hypothetical protein
MHVLKSTYIPSFTSGSGKKKQKAEESTDHMESRSLQAPVQFYNRGRRHSRIALSASDQSGFPGTSIGRHVRVLENACIR